MTHPMAIMCAGFTTEKVNPDEFNDWYDTEHIPERLRVKGFVNAERWVGADDPNIAFATYDLDNEAVLQSTPYLTFTGEHQSPWTRRIESQLGKIGRFVGVQLNPGRQAAPPNAGGLLMVAMNIEAHAEADFNAWYDTEHLPRLSGVAGCLCARRFRASSGPNQYFAIYHLATPEVCATPAWKAAAATPWTAKISAHFSARLRVVMRRYQRRG